jgi:hypothetical protein
MMSGRPDSWPLSPRLGQIEPAGSLQLARC